MATVSAPEVVRERPRLMSAAAFALLAEVLLLGGGLALLTHRSHAPAELPPTLLTLAAPTPAPKPAVAQPKPEAPSPVHPVVPVHRVAHVAPPKPVALPSPRPAPTPAPVMPAATPTDPKTVPRPPPPPPAAAPAPAVSAATPSFEGALRAAIQAALRYPESARMAGMAGRTRVAFQYRDGEVSNVSVVVSSGVGLLDRAALAAVRDATYPRPEPAFVGKTLAEQLWVTFNLDDHE